MASNRKLAIALHVSIVLAYHEEGLVTSDKLSFSLNMSRVAVRRFVAELVSAGLIDSRRGKCGGLRLARPPQDITVWDVYQAIGSDPPFVLPPTPPEEECPVGRVISPILSGLFSTVDDLVEDCLRGVTVLDLRAQVPEST